MIRKAYQQSKKKQKRSLPGHRRGRDGGGARRGGYAYYGHVQLHGSRRSRSFVLHHEIAGRGHRQLRAAAVGVGRDAGPDIVKSYLARRRQMETNYDQFISNLNLYNHTLTPQEKLILRVTRLSASAKAPRRQSIWRKSATTSAAAENSTFRRR